jgi:hypothetical protein
MFRVPKLAAAFRIPKLSVVKPRFNLMRRRRNLMRRRPNSFDRFLRMMGRGTGSRGGNAATVQNGSGFKAARMPGSGSPSRGASGMNRSGGISGRGGGTPRMR